MKCGRDDVREREPEFEDVDPDTREDALLADLVPDDILVDDADDGRGEDAGEAD